MSPILSGSNAIDQNHNDRHPVIILSHLISLPINLRALYGSYSRLSLGRASLDSAAKKHSQATSRPPKCSHSLSTKSILAQNFLVPSDRLLLIFPPSPLPFCLQLSLLPLPTRMNMIMCALHSDFAKAAHHHLMAHISSNTRDCHFNAHSSPPQSAIASAHAITSPHNETVILVHCEPPQSVFANLPL